MEKYNVKFKKKFGQNFLKDESVVNKIIDISEIKDNSLVIEVGPGGAILTKKLADSCKQVVAYEIDVDLEKELNKKLSCFSNIDILYGDFLQKDIVNDLENYDYDHLYFISNVPYYITTPIILKLLKSGLLFTKIVMMVQKEVGERFSASPCSKNYGSISVYLNYFYDIKYEFFVGRDEFIPAPNVDSCIISFSAKEKLIPLNDEGNYEKLISDAFRFKRKNLRNNLGKYDNDIVISILSKYGYDLSNRAEEIPYEVFVELSNNLF